MIILLQLYIFYLSINRENKCLYRDRITNSQIVRMVSILILNVFYKDRYCLPGTICFSFSTTYCNPFGANTPFYFSSFRCSVANASEYRKTFKRIGACVQDGLTHFLPMLHFYTPWKHQKVSDILMFSVGIEVERSLKWRK